MHRIRIIPVRTKTFLGLQQVVVKYQLMTDGVMTRDFGEQSIGLDGNSHLDLTIPDNWVTEFWGTDKGEAA